METIDYYTLQETAEKSYHDRDYKKTKKCCLQILENISLLKKNIPDFDELNKPFIDYAINVVFHSDIDEVQKKILKHLYNENLFNKNMLNDYLEISTFNNLKFAKNFFSYLNMLNMIDENEVKLFLIQAKESIDYCKNHVVENQKLNNVILSFIRNNPDVLQKNMYSELQSHLKNMSKDEFYSFLYSLSNSGKIKRVKKGNTYAISIV